MTSLKPIYDLMTSLKPIYDLMKTSTCSLFLPYDLRTFSQDCIKTSSKPSSWVFIKAWPCLGLNRVLLRFWCGLHQIFSVFMWLEQ